MPKRRNPCSAIQRCSPSENRRRRPFVQAQARRIRPARANRYATDTAGGTFPNWKVMASQVDPQMRTEVRYKPRTLMIGPQRPLNGLVPGSYPVKGSIGPGPAPGRAPTSSVEPELDGRALAGPTIRVEFPMRGPC